MNLVTIVNTYIGETSNPWASEIKENQEQIKLTNEWDDLSLGAIDVFLTERGAVVDAMILNQAGIIEVGIRKAVPRTEVISQILEYQSFIEQRRKEQNYINPNFFNL
ncbi:MAG: hypothetical protein GOU97_04845 [Nanoarchaeota archaeon]|nr:hypothetical protein [Nanoarchaeota archaeon]